MCHQGLKHNLSTNPCDPLHFKIENMKYLKVSHPKFDSAYFTMTYVEIGTVAYNEPVKCLGWNVALGIKKKCMLEITEEKDLSLVSHFLIYENDFTRKVSKELWNPNVKKFKCI